MPDRLTFEAFVPRLGKKFEAPGGMELVLAECEETPHPGMNGLKKQFQLLFIGPISPVLPQRIYTLREAEMGELEIFIVPIGPDARGMQYQAVFT